jgi:hypothetical protein
VAGDEVSGGRGSERKIKKWQEDEKVTGNKQMKKG